MTTNVDEKDHDLVFQGMKEAIGLEVQRLRDEGWPVLVWRDGKVVDIGRELEMQETGRAWFLIGFACSFVISILFGMIGFDTKWLPIGILKSFSMFMGVMCVGAYGLGAWYGDKHTRPICLVFLAVLFPLLACLIYSYFVNGFFADF